MAYGNPYVRLKLVLPQTTRGGSVHERKSKNWPWGVYETKHMHV